jgi:hypothetical protein
MSRAALSPAATQRDIAFVVGTFALWPYRNVRRTIGCLPVAQERAFAAVLPDDEPGQQRPPVIRPGRSLIRMRADKAPRPPMHGDDETQAGAQFQRAATLARRAAAGRNPGLVQRRVRC